MTSRSPDTRTGRLRVAVVDDDDDIRELLRLQFEYDDRFEVVGEAKDGQAAIELVSTVRPDLLVLDRNMPRLTGVDAMPEIKRRSPETAVILYTASADGATYQAALAAGALQVLDKAAIADDFVGSLVRALLDRSARPDADVEVAIGPVSAEAARRWVANTSRILEAVRRHPEVLETPVPDDMLDLFAGFLVQWGEAAASTQGEFRWVARAGAAQVARVVEHWALLDRMTDEQLEALGVEWSSPEARPFFHALTDGVLRALQRHQETRRLAELLQNQWPGDEPT